MAGSDHDYGKPERVAVIVRFAKRICQSQCFGFTLGQPISFRVAFSVA